MLVLFETAAGFALFKVLDEGKLKNPDNLAAEFTTADKAANVVKLKHFKRFENTAEALECSTGSLMKERHTIMASPPCGTKAWEVTYRPKLNGIIDLESYA